MSRIAGLPVEQWDPDLRAKLQSAGIDPSQKQYRASAIMAHAPHMAKANMAYLGTATQGQTLSPRLLELVRLRLAFHNQCRSCMAMRFQAAVSDGLTEDLVCSLEKPSEAPDLTEREKAALEYADVFAINHFAITDDTFRKLREHFSEADWWSRDVRRLLFRHGSAIRQLGHDRGTAHGLSGQVDESGALDGTRGSHAGELVSVLVPREP